MNSLKNFSSDAHGLVSIKALAALNIYFGGNTEISRQALTEFLHEKIIRDIIDPTSEPVNDNKLNPKEQNLQNTTDNVFSLSPQVNSSLLKLFLKIINSNNSTNSTRNYSKRCSKN